VITLASRSFTGPFMAPLWSAPASAGLYAVMAPGWRPLTFRALHFDQSGELAAPGLLKQHPKYREWIGIVGTEWNLYIATLEMALSTPSERGAVLRSLAREYRPEFKPIQEISVGTLLLAQAMRTNRDN
jgi:hypothetical protein